MAETFFPSDAGLEVRTYFVRGRNALVARAEFGELYVDYYLHLAQYGLVHEPRHDQILKDALAAVTLHCASRPWKETVAWTVNFQEPLVNIFVTGDNPQRTVVGHLFTEGVKVDEHNLFCADVVRTDLPARRSVVTFGEGDFFGAVERLYAQSEQRPARYFRFGEEDIVLVSAQPGCDLGWIGSLDDEAIRALDETEELSLLERRRYRWQCGCSQERMLRLLAPTHRADPESLFGADEAVRISCPRCGSRHVLTREAMEAFVAGGEPQSGDAAG